MMLPKIHHIRVAAKAFKNYDIPKELVSLWRYLNSVYGCDVFRKTCPPDQEIVYHWASKPETPSLPQDKVAFYSTESPPRYFFDIPIKLK